MSFFKNKNPQNSPACDLKHPPGSLKNTRASSACFRQARSVASQCHFKVAPRFPSFLFAFSPRYYLPPVGKMTTHTHGFFPPLPHQLQEGDSQLGLGLGRAPCPCPRSTGSPLPPTLHPHPRGVLQGVHGPKPRAGACSWKCRRCFQNAESLFVRLLKSSKAQQPPSQHWLDFAFTAAA